TVRYCMTSMNNKIRHSHAPHVLSIDQHNLDTPTHRLPSNLDRLLVLFPIASIRDTLQIELDFLAEEPGLGLFRPSRPASRCRLGKHGSQGRGCNQPDLIHGLVHGGIHGRTAIHRLALDISAHGQSLGAHRRCAIDRLGHNGLHAFGARLNASVCRLGAQSVCANNLRLDASVDRLEVDERVVSWELDVEWASHVNVAIDRLDRQFAADGPRARWVERNGAIDGLDPECVDGCLGNRGESARELDHGRVRVWTRLRALDAVRQIDRVDCDRFKGSACHGNNPDRLLLFVGTCGHDSVIGRRFWSAAEDGHQQVDLDTRADN
ncbi:hypothetical protein BCR44DRAFT_289639, partial [Catenaria anguillulae PL171]